MQTVFESTKISHKNKKKIGLRMQNAEGNLQKETKRQRLQTLSYEQSKIYSKKITVLVVILV